MLTETSHRVVEYGAVNSVELFADGNTVSSTVLSSQIGGALVGGLAFGGVGAVIGGLSGKTVTTAQVCRIDLRMVVNDMHRPLHDVAFLRLITTKGEAAYESAMGNARQWHGLLSGVVRNAEAAPKPSVIGLPSNGGSSSVADELKKLADLLAAGMLTKEEFDQQKSKILAAN